MAEIVRSSMEPLLVDVALRGEVTSHEVAYAREKLAGVVHLVDEPILHARIVLTRAADPARARPVIVQADLDLNGRPVRAHVAAHNVEEATDLLVRRLRDKLEHRLQRAQRRESIRTLGMPPEPGEWRHGTPPTERPEYFDRPIEDRQLVARKTLAVDQLTPDEAAFDMGQLDYGFYLFRDLAGEDCLLAHTGDGSYSLARLHQTGEPVGPTAVSVRVLELPVPALEVAEAIERLNATHEPYLFFQDAASGRGAVAYRRYDGHYGLLTVAANQA